MTPSQKNKNPNQSKPNYAFIDSQNLNLGVQKMGWKMDWRKFRLYLREVHNVEQAYMFIGYMPDYEKLYEQMHELGYLIVLKPTLEMFQQDKGEGGSGEGGAEKRVHSDEKSEERKHAP